MKQDARQKLAEPKAARGKSRAESSSPAAIRRRMAETQEDLANRLGTLKERVLGVLGIQPKGDTNTMAEKKTTKGTTKPAHAAKKSKTSATKRTGTKSGRTGASRKSTAKTTLAKVERQAKQVLGKALKGAAEGAVRGAVEAVVPSEKGKKSKKKEESDQ
jgi:hypothetical protein